MTENESKPGVVCPSCGETASGNFCEHCGASLGGQFCNQCGAKLSPGAKFCSECGAGVGAAAQQPAAAGAVASSGHERREAAAEVVGGQNLPWWIAGGAMFALIFMVGLSMVRPGGPPAPTAGSTPAAATAAGTGAPPDISNMSSTEAADRLFNRVMSYIETGDDGAAQQFLPMAIAAHQRAEPLNHDRRFHLSWLNRIASNLEAALADAADILGEDPNHLLGLAAAAEASIELGEMDEAAEYYQHLLDIYDTESQRPLEEYTIHGNIVAVLKRDAENFLAQR